MATSRRAPAALVKEWQGLNRQMDTLRAELAQVSAQKLEIVEALRDQGYSVTGAAQLLGVTRQVLYNLKWKQ